MLHWRHFDTELLSYHGHQLEASGKGPGSTIGYQQYSDGNILYFLNVMLPSPSLELGTMLTRTHLRAFEVKRN